MCGQPDLALAAGRSRDKSLGQAGSGFESPLCQLVSRATLAEPLSLSFLV